MNEPDPTLKAKRIVEAALDRKAELPVVLDMRELTAYADTFIILSGRSDRQVRSIAESIVHELKSNGEPPLGVEGLDDDGRIRRHAEVCRAVLAHGHGAEDAFQDERAALGDGLHAAVKVDRLGQQFQDALLALPNVPDPSVPDGTRTLLPWFGIELELPPDAPPVKLGTIGQARFLIARKPLPARSAADRVGIGLQPARGAARRSRNAGAAAKRSIALKPTLGAACQRVYVT